MIEEVAPIAHSGPHIELVDCRDVRESSVDPELEIESGLYSMGGFLNESDGRA